MAAKRTSIIFRFLCGGFLAFVLADVVVVSKGESLGLWSFPGDFATVEADGTISLLGRGSQVINTAGEKVFAEEVEETLKTHPAVDDCLVFGLPDERYGQSITALVSLVPGCDTDPHELRSQLVSHAKATLASYKAPRRVIVVDTVPRAANGKADYASARSLAEE